jgi:uncharacterized protein YcfJ
MERAFHGRNAHFGSSFPKIAFHDGISYKSDGYVSIKVWHDLGYLLGYQSTLNEIISEDTMGSIQSENNYGIDSIFGGAQDVATSVGEAAKSAKNEYFMDSSADLNRAAKAYRTKGLLAGTIELADALDPINQLGHVLDAAGILPDDPVAKNIFTGASRLFMGGPVAPLLAIKDAFDVHQGIRSRGQSHQVMAPNERYQEICRGHKSGPVGYSESCPTKDFPSFFQSFVRNAACGALSNLGPHNESRRGERSRGGAKWGSVDALPEGACFEDFVAAFMVDVVKQEQKRARTKMNELKALDKAKKKANVQKTVSKVAKKLGQTAGSIVGGCLGGTAGMGVGSMCGEQFGQLAGNAMNPSKDKADMLKSAEDRASEIDDSRALKMEELKNIMNRLQQMQQALSAVLNVMHGAAMNSIRNIR